MSGILIVVHLLLSIPSLFLFVATPVTEAGLLTLQPDRPFFWIPAGLAFSFLFRYGLSMSFAVVLGEHSAFLITGHSTLHGLASGLASNDTGSNGICVSLPVSSFRDCRFFYGVDQVGPLGTQAFRNVQPSRRYLYFRYPSSSLIVSFRFYRYRTPTWPPCL